MECIVSEVISIIRFWRFGLKLPIYLSVLLLLQMFVRLFVDENLDRVSPISKQPKDKIQAILEACDRQFPEFHVRSRKRIRTYLKSCRRLRRSKDLPDSPQVIGCVRLHAG